MKCIMHNDIVFGTIGLIPIVPFFMFHLIYKGLCGIMRRRLTRGEFETFLT